MKNSFESNIVNIYGDRGKQWLDDLPAIISKIANKWHLTKLSPVANLSMNYVATGLMRHQEVIVKLSLDKASINREYNALNALSSYAAVKVLAYQPGALLLEKLSPSTSLKTYLPSRREEAIEIACQTTKRLHKAPLPKNIDLPTIEERFSLLDKEWLISQDYLILARKFRDEIFAKNHIRKILHGDLHHDNIIQDGNFWKVIDPHGVIGFPINEVWAFVYDMDKDIPFIAKCFDFKISDVQKCCFMHSVLSAVWAVEDNMNPTFWLDLASKYKPSA